MMEWQPIETAPKDGSKVLLTDGDRTEIAHWWGKAQEGFWEVWTCEPFYEDFKQPTHWMPLPQPPKKAD